MLLIGILFIFSIGIPINSTEEIVISQARNKNISYLSTDWVINSEENILKTNETILLNGNLIIEKGGSLTLKNVTLLLNCTTNGTYRIEVFGTLKVFDFDNDSSTINDTSNITSSIADGKHRFEFVVNKNSSLVMKNSELHECGYLIEEEGKNYGFTISGNKSILINNTITNNFWGILLNASNDIIISNNTIQN